MLNRLRSHTSFGSAGYLLLHPVWCILTPFTNFLLSDLFAYISLSFSTRAYCFLRDLRSVVAHLLTSSTRLLQSLLINSWVFPPFGFIVRNIFMLLVYLRPEPLRPYDSVTDRPTTGPINWDYPKSNVLTKDLYPVVPNSHIIAGSDSMLWVLLFHAFYSCGVPENKFAVEPKEHRKHDCQNYTHRIRRQK